MRLVCTEILSSIFSFPLHFHLLPFLRAVGLFSLPYLVHASRPPTGRTLRGIFIPETCNALETIQICGGLPLTSSPSLHRLKGLEVAGKITGPENVSVLKTRDPIPIHNIYIIYICMCLCVRLHTTLG